MKSPASHRPSTLLSLAAAISAATLCTLSHHKLLADPANLPPQVILPATLPAQAIPPQELLKPSPAAEPDAIPESGLAAPRIDLAASALNRGEPIKGQFLLPDPIPSGPVELNVRVSDSQGRLLVNQTLPAAAPVPPKGQLLNTAARAVPFEIPVTGILAMRHLLQISATGPDGKPIAASVNVVYRPPVAWDDYYCNIWQRPTAQRMEFLKKIYLNGSQGSGGSVTAPDELVDGNFRFYIEGTGNWVYSSYHHSYPDKRPNNYEYYMLRKAFEKDRSNKLLLQRDPCLSDPIIQGRIETQFVQVASRNRDYSPFFYSVADEPGIADQAAAFDFCFSRYCQDRFRIWLKERYSSLDALNAEWGTQYADWSAVQGQTTDELFARKDDNFSAWSDFRDFQDDVQVSGYGIAKNAMRRGDPRGRIAFGGAQGPTAVGCWDFWKLSRIMDAMECYYIGNNYELLRGFDPNLILNHTCFPGKPDGSGVKISQRLSWYTFILGDRAEWVWDDNKDLVAPDGKPSDIALAMMPHWKELTDGIGMLRIASQRAAEPIAIYESQPSLRVHWVQEVRPEGAKWVQRTSRTERTENKFLFRRESWVMLLEDNGFQPHFISPAQALTDLVPYDPATGKGFKALVLPQILAMSQPEADAIKKFVSDGGTVLVDGIPAQFDEHGKKLDQPLLAALLNPEKRRNADKGRAILLDKDVQNYYGIRLSPTNEEFPLRDYIGGLLRDAMGTLRPSAIEVVGEDGKPVTGVMTTIWHNGKADLVALIRNPELRIDGLGDMEYKTNDKFEKPVKLIVRNADSSAWYDVRENKSLGAAKEVTVTLQPFQPIFLTSFPAPAVDFTASADLGARKLSLKPGANCPLDKAVYHLDFTTPDGKPRLEYRQNVSVPPTGGEVELPLAMNDIAGNWTLTIREVATGKTLSIPIPWRK